VLFAWGLACCGSQTAPAQSPDPIGLTVFRAMTTNLDAAGIRVAQAEAETATNPPAFEVNPAVTGRAADLFTYYSVSGASAAYPNAVGAESGHADDVAKLFYGLTSGVATNVLHVDNYDADYFYNNVINAFLPPDINDPIVNQSFIFGSVPSQVSLSEQQQIDSAYDNYAAKFGTLFVSGAGNSGRVCPAATAYNGIGVAAYGGASSVGPTVDNGRCKPDLTAPAGATSYSTPQVAGAAALLLQAAWRGDGGTDTNAAADIRTLKALLLNGAVKPSIWTNAPSSPLDSRFGAGVLNVFNAYEQLAGGKHGFIESTVVSSGSGHPPGSGPGNVAVLNGWDFNTNSSSLSSGTVKHYYFDTTGAAPFRTLTATLVWNRPNGQSGINNLDLFLYDCANSNLVACSTSLVDNVEHIFVPKLAPGRYDLQVLMNAGGLSLHNNAEPYALAYAFTSTALGGALDGSRLTLTWPVYPAGFHVEATTNLSSPAWSTNQLPAATLANGQNVLVLNRTNATQFFRLRQTP
jgi:hypothetical protein